MIVALIVNANFKGRGFMLFDPGDRGDPHRSLSQIWAYMLVANRTGFFNTALWYLGVGNGDILFLSDPALQLPSMIVIDVWKTMSFMALLLLAGLQLIPADSTRQPTWTALARYAVSSNSPCPCEKVRLPLHWFSEHWTPCVSLTFFRSCSGQARYSMVSFTDYKLIKNRAMGHSSRRAVS